MVSFLGGGGKKITCPPPCQNLATEIFGDSSVCIGVYVPVSGEVENPSSMGETKYPWPDCKAARLGGKVGIQTISIPLVLEKPDRENKWSGDTNRRNVSGEVREKIIYHYMESIHSRV